MKSPAGGFSVSKLTKDKLPSLPFLQMKDAALGKGYALSLVIAGDKRSQSLNVQYRKKSYVPNVLSFPLDEHSGEIFLNLKQAKREHKARGETFDYFVALLFIHSMLHLKGYAHSATMEREEQKLLAKFHIVNR
jgi:probable rRNA maturation factor